MQEVIKALDLEIQYEYGLLLQTAVDTANNLWNGMAIISDEDIERNPFKKEHLLGIIYGGQGGLTEWIKMEEVNSKLKAAEVGREWLQGMLECEHVNGDMWTKIRRVYETLT